LALGGASWETALLPKPAIVSPGRLTTSNPLDGHLAMDEATIEDGLIEDVLDLLNDALGG